jgi:hypothetical protein
MIHGVVSIKQNIDFNFQPSSMLVLLAFHKNGLIKSCSSFEDLSALKFHNPTLNGASFASTSEV